MNQTVGNILGNPRAESDRLLSKAFIETSDLRALIETEDFHIVVGRRGTGKSALFQKVQGHFESQPRVHVHAETQKEHFALAVQALFDREKHNYRTARAACRILWRSYILAVLAHTMRRFSKIEDYKLAQQIREYFEHVPIFPLSDNAYEFMQKAIEHHVNAAPNMLPSTLATFLRIDELEGMVRHALQATHNRAIVLFDSLDEGWQPSELPTALLGGLALAATDLVERKTSIHVIAFVRDNMFRALAYFDSDFSRHIEGADLRLRWDEGSLFHFTAERIRVALNLNIENDVRAWGRFAQRGIEGRIGFEQCLKQTLYRPRDVLVLLNKAYLIASNLGRNQIIDENVTAASIMISGDRLGDLLKEYDRVFPGLRLFVEVFQGTRAIWKYEDILVPLNKALAEQSYTVEEASDFAILGTGNEIFMALYSVGFLGVQRDGTSPYVFCHDGASPDIMNLSPDASIAIHPCYWRALDISDTALDIDMLTHVYDEYQPVQGKEIRDRRMQRLGQVIEELPRLREGAEDASAFEEWVLRAIRIIFAGSLSNVALHPNGDAVQRRDIVATNNAQSGFWRRVYEDYAARQVIFEIKNYANLSIDNVRQALSYSGNAYGRIVFLVYRGENEGASEKERSWLLEMFTHPHNLVVFLLPASILARFLSKYRTHKRVEYWQTILDRRLDTHLRSYLNIKSPRTAKKKSGRNRVA